jgi:hypothetical protein
MGCKSGRVVFQIDDILTCLEVLIETDEAISLILLLGIVEEDCFKWVLACDNKEKSLDALQLLDLETGEANMLIESIPSVVNTFLELGCEQKPPLSLLVWLNKFSNASCCNLIK